MTPSATDNSGTGRAAWLDGPIDRNLTGPGLVAEVEKQLKSDAPLSAYAVPVYGSNGNQIAAGAGVEAGGLINWLMLDVALAIPQGFLSAGSIGSGVICNLGLSLWCFTGDMQVNTRRGFIRFDKLTVEDQVLSAPEDDPHTVPEFRQVEEIFQTVARIWHLHTQGQVIRTTPQHQFYVWGKGWVPAWALAIGDLLRSDTDEFVAVEDICDGGYEESVYNCRIAEYRTYYVTIQLVNLAQLRNVAFVSLSAWMSRLVRDAGNY